MMNGIGPVPGPPGSKVLEDFPFAALVRTGFTVMWTPGAPFRMHSTVRSWMVASLLVVQSTYLYNKLVDRVVATSESSHKTTVLM